MYECVCMFMCECVCMLMCECVCMFMCECVCMFMCECVNVFACVVRAIPAVGCVRVRVVCWVGNGSRDLPKGSSMGATLAFRRTGMCIAPPTWHMRCAAWYYKYRCMLFCNPPSRESGTLVITESFGLRHQEEPCACGEPRVSPDNTCSCVNVFAC